MFIMSLRLVQSDLALSIKKAKTFFATYSAGSRFRDIECPIGFKSNAGVSHLDINFINFVV